MKNFKDIESVIETIEKIEIIKPKDCSMSIMKNTTGNNEYIRYLSTDCCITGKCNDGNDFVIELKNVESINYIKTNNAHWISDYCDSLHQYIHKCSVCGRMINTECEGHEFTFCPYCGVKMNNLI